MIILLFLGLPGSGKGTQAKILEKKNILKQISVGDLLRNYANSDAPEWQEINKKLGQGHLLPDLLVNKVVKQELDKINTNCILDGYPRSMPQAKFIHKHFHGSVLRAVNFEISEEIIEKRITGRFSCASCATIYNKYYSPTKEKDICDNCKGSKFYYRKDDNLDSLKKRFLEYSTVTKKVINYYKGKEKKLLINIDASLPSTDITIQLESKIDEIKKTR